MMRTLCSLVTLAAALAAAGSAQAGVQLYKIVPVASLAAPGGHNGEVNSEYVTIRNAAVKPKVLTGWTLHERKAGLVFRFPAFTLCPGCRVKIHSGRGTNTRTDLFWGRATFSWVDAGDTATLRRRTGRLQDSCTYPGPGIPPPPTPGKPFYC